jgi:hypothetical protein
MKGIAARLFPVPALFLVGLPAIAGAQAIELRLREETTKEPVPGAIVRLLGEKGPLAQALTNEQGRVVLRAPGAGIYHIKADRIGYRGLLIGPIELASADTYRRDIDMPASRLELPTLEVRGKSACEAGGQGGSLAVALWEEVGKALTANVITQRQRPVPLHVREFQRDLDRDGNPLREWVHASRLTQGQPFGSSPAAVLASKGFVEESSDTIIYHAPDAPLILSDEFVATHCFRSIPGTGQLVGLAFEPTPGRKVSDVQGTLWVDRSTSELKFLEYGYTGLSGARDKAKLGGRVEFRRLPGGEWIIGYWHIRMARLEPDTLKSVRGIRTEFYVVERLAGFVEQGGRAEIAEDGVIPIARAILVGRVHDSTTGKGLAGVFVQVRGYRDSILTDHEGRFELVVAAVGPQTAVASHPKLGLLRTLPLRPVLLSLGDTTRIEFTVPSIPTFVRALCGSTQKGRSGVVGLARAPVGVPPDDLQVRVAWQTAGGGTRQDRASPGKNGAFALCDLPPDRPLELQLVHQRMLLKEQAVRLDWGQFTWADLAPPGISSVPD